MPSIHTFVNLLAQDNSGLSAARVRMDVSHTVEMFRSSLPATTFNSPSPILCASELGQCLELEVACEVDGFVLMGEMLQKHPYTTKVLNLLETNVHGAEHLMLKGALDDDQVIRGHLSIEPKADAESDLIWKKLKIEIKAPSGLVQEVVGLLSHYLTLAHPALFGLPADHLQEFTTRYMRALMTRDIVANETKMLYEATLERIRSDIESLYSPKLKQVLKEAGWIWTDRDLIKKLVEDAYISSL